MKWLHFILLMNKTIWEMKIKIEWFYFEMIKFYLSSYVIQIKLQFYDTRTCVHCSTDNKGLPNNNLVDLSC